MSAYSCQTDTAASLLVSARRQFRSWAARDRLSFAVFVLSVLLAALLYLNSLHGQFVYDDMLLVDTNRAVRSLSFANVKHILTQSVTSTYRPFRVLSYALDYAVWGMKPFGFHLTNVLFHTANTVLFFSLIWLMFGKVRWAAFSALLFAVHPVQSECVAWISGRKDLQAMFFILIGMTCHVLGDRERPRTRIAYGFISLVCFLAALLTKEHSIAFLGLIPLYYICRERSIRPMTLIRAAGHTVPFLVVGVVFMFFYFRISGAHGKLPGYHGGDAYATVLMMFKAIAFYTGLILFPVRLRVDYWAFAVPRSIVSFGVIPGLTVVAALLVIALISLRRAPWVTFGIGWFFILLAPVSNIVPIVTKVAERYLYMAAAGFYLVFGYLFSEICSWAAVKQRGLRHVASWGAVTLVVLVFSGLGLRTVLRNEDWAAERALWTALLQNSPSDFVAHYGLGRVFHALGNSSMEPRGKAECFAVAESHYKRAYELNRGYVRPFIGLIHVKLDSGEDGPNLAAMLKKAAHAGKHDAIVQADVARYFKLHHEYEKAAEYYKKAVELKPDVAAFHRDLGRTYIEAGCPEKALAEFRKVLELDPTAFPILSDMGSAYLAMNDYVNAVRVLLPATRRFPANSAIAYNLAYAYEQLGEYGAALSVYDRTMERYPDTTAFLSPRRNVVALKLSIEGNSPSAMSYLQLGRALGVVERLDEALGALEEAVRLAPESAAARCTLGAMYLTLGRLSDAKGAMKEALALDAREPQAWLGMAMVHAEEKNAPESVRCLSMAARFGGEGTKAVVKQMPVFEKIKDSPELKGFLMSPAAGQETPRNGEVKSKPLP